jgi:hypothetical protein
LARYLVGEDAQLATVCEPLVVTQVFAGLTFRLDRIIAVPDFALLIQQNGGNISNVQPGLYISCSSPDADRTPVWVERCIDVGTVLDPAAFPFYTPPIATVDGGSVCVSGFAGAMRLDIIAAIKWLGMSYRPELTRAVDVLVAQGGDSEKVRTAIRWGINVCTVGWLFAVARGHPPTTTRDFCSASRMRGRLEQSSGPSWMTKTKRTSRPTSSSRSTQYLAPAPRIQSRRNHQSQSRQS